MTEIEDTHNSPDTLSLGDPVTSAIGAIQSELKRNPERPMTLTPPAQAAITVEHADYLVDLTRESIRIARRDSLSYVDREHVGRAIRTLGTHGSRLSGWATASLAVGGVVAGTGLTSAVDLLSNTTPTARDILIAFVLSVVGAVLLVVGIGLSSNRLR